MVIIMLSRTFMQICTIKLRELLLLTQASSTAKTVKVRRAHSTHASEAMPRIMKGIVHRFAKWFKISRILPQGERFMLFSGLVPQRSHMAPAKKSHYSFKLQHNILLYLIVPTVDGFRLITTLC